jgi:hypothetical protein
MSLLSYDYGSMQKYIIHSGKKIHYVYKIFFLTGVTELTKYNNDLGTISFEEIKSIIPFNKGEPLKSIEKFYKILFLQS